MSSEEQQPSTQENDNNKKDNQNKLNNNDIKELIKIPFVKELLVKIDVLKNGLLDERKKTTLLANKIKELDVEIKAKAEQIKTLIQEKNDYEKKEAERKKEEENKNKNKKNSDMSLTANEEIRKLNEEITNLKFENETYQKKLNGTLIETEDMKHEYKNQIKSLSELNNSLLTQIKNLKSEKEELEKKLKEAASSSSMSIREKEHFEALLKEYKKAKEEAMHQLNACLDKCSKLVIENKTYKDSIALHEIDAGKMAQKLAEYKNMLIKVNLRNQIFHVKKCGLVSSNGIDIIFGQDKEGNYVMRIDEKDKIEVINIQDVESVNIIDTKKNKVEICYMYKAKKYRLNVFVDELIIEQIVEAYKNFYTESMKNQNKLNY